jgi:hypothetical protein
MSVTPNSPKQTAASVTAPTVPTQITVDGDSKSKSPPASPSQDTTTEQMIEKISKLQDLENRKYDDLNILLASNPTPDNIAQQKVLISDITQLTSVRSQLFNTLLLHAKNNVNMNNTMNANVKDKHTIVTLKENDLNARKTATAALSQDVENTKRMVDINVYYKKQYEARVVIMKYIIVLCFMVIFFVVLMNLGWLPQEMVIVLVVIIILGGGLYIGSLIYDAYKRSNINYDEYNWGFNSQDSQEMASSNSNQPTSKKSRSKDRTCRTSDDSMSSSLESMYKSVSSSASSIEDSIKSSSTTLMSDLTPSADSGDPPAPAASSSSISAASTAGSGSGSTTTVLPPSVQSKVSESFMLSKVPQKYFSQGMQGGATPFTMEDNYGKI